MFTLALVVAANVHSDTSGDTHTQNISVNSSVLLKGQNKDKGVCQEVKEAYLLGRLQGRKKGEKWNECTGRNTSKAESRGCREKTKRQKWEEFSQCMMLKR